MHFRWYQIIENSDELQQGDFILKCPIVKPPKKIDINETIDFEVTFIDSIILSQSCDLANENIEIVLVCAYYSLSDFLKGLPSDQTLTTKAKNKAIDNLRKGFLPGYHLLNKSELDDISDYQVVDFRNVYGIHLDSLKSICKNLSKRTRLLPPYREHLSQAFARYFMRVGLPQDIKVVGYN